MASSKNNAREGNPPRFRVITLEEYTLYRRMIIRNKKLRRNEQRKKVRPVFVNFFFN